MKQQRVQMVNRPGDEAVKKFRSSSVMLYEAEEVFPRMDNAATHAGNAGELPENVRAALMKAKEVVEAKKANMRDMELLYALYLRIQFGFEETCDEKQKEGVDSKVLEKWKGLDSKRVEDLYIDFASELALRS